MKKRKTGTKELADTNINIAIGCPHGCRYCYARHMLVDRFHKLKPEQWKKETVNLEKVNKILDKRPKYNGTVMFPSSHDITTEILYDCMITLRALLAAGNKVAITTKAHFVCVAGLCFYLNEFRDQIIFRFTIGSTSDIVLKFWEPGAPNFAERAMSLKYAKEHGFETSILAEPFLDGNVRLLYELLLPWVTESFWVGKLRNFNTRVDQSAMTQEEIDNFVKPLLDYQSDEAIKILYEDLNGKDLIRWKDSIREVIKKYE